MNRIRAVLLMHDRPESLLNAALSQIANHMGICGILLLCCVNYSSASKR
jgi:hypothetical protein